MKKDGLKLACMYSIVTNKLGYCGPKGGYRELEKYVAKGDNEKETGAVLKKYESLYPYLELISEHNDRNVFDYDVVDAYWIGNSLLENVPVTALRAMIALEFPKRGLPARFAEKLAEKTPEEALPHHSFHVLHIYTITGRLSRGNEKKCLITLKEDGCSHHWNEKIERLSKQRAANLRKYTLGNMEALGVEESVRQQLHL
jgi:hypothetical protein